MAVGRKVKQFVGVKLDECSRKYQAFLDGSPIKGLYSSEIEAAMARTKEAARRANRKQPNQ